MHLTKALAAISAGSLLLIGHSTLAYAQDDPYTDEERDQQSQTTQDESTQDSDTMSSDDYQASTQDDDSWSSDTETTADVDTSDDPMTTEDDMSSDVESQSTMDTYAQTEDDEYSADVAVDSESSVAQTEDDSDWSADVDVDSDSTVAATEDDDDFNADVDVDADSDATVAATEDDDLDVNADVDSSAAMGGEAELQEQVASIDVEVNVDESKIRELAQIHVEMQEDTRDLADQMSGASSTADAQELQAQMVDRQVAVIERHGWTRDEYNAVVDAVNENPDLRAQFIEEVVNSDTAVARTESEDPSQPQDEDTDW